MFIMVAVGQSTGGNYNEPVFVRPVYDGEKVFSCMGSRCVDKHTIVYFFSDVQFCLVFDRVVFLQWSFCEHILR